MYSDSESHFRYKCCRKRVINPSFGDMLYNVFQDKVRTFCKNRVLNDPVVFLNGKIVLMSKIVY